MALENKELNQDILHILEEEEADSDKEELIALLHGSLNNPPSEENTSSPQLMVGSLGENLGDQTALLYGELNKQVFYLEYKGSTTSTAITSIAGERDNNRVISVNVLKVPSDLRIKESFKTLLFNGSQPVEVDLTPYALDVTLLDRVELDPQVEIEDGQEVIKNYLKFYDKAGREIASVDIAPFIQEQANLAETDSSKETFVRNKSTKYLENEGEDGSSPYTTVAAVDQIKTDLETSISNEQTRAENAESNLNTLITNEQTRAEGVEEELLGKINQEITDRQEAISAEEERATGVENTLSGRIDQEISDRQEAINTAISEEAAARQNADNNLGSRIDGVISTAQGISLAETTGGKLIFTNPFNSPTSTIEVQGGFLPDEKTVYLNDDNEIAIKVASSEDVLGLFTLITTK